MLNLNYNLIGTAKQNRNIEGFAASPRLDPYSASLFLAIPGTVFLQDYEPLFGAVNPWDDISGFIRTGNAANNLSSSLTGSGTFSSNVDFNNFTLQGYPSSLYVSGGIAAYFPVSTPFQGLSLNTGSLQAQANDKGCLIEFWAGFPVTGAFSPINGSNPEKTAIIQPTSNDGNVSAGNYWLSPGFGGDIAPPPSAPIYVSGSVRFVKENFGDVTPPTEQIFYVSPSGSQNLGPFAWKHYAVSVAAPTPSKATTCRMYINGVLVSEEQVTDNFAGSTDVVQVFGYARNPNKETPAYFQDLRVYNGTNKNYTGSLIPVPQSMIVARP